ncbi:mechanosensitive ion channel family protein [Methanocella sp. MCL-LM]|uniref:mechanosensitive ion channel family protein n=1 Tax=Methanocella sp. MCL-LM TaxID=3412035 RepID=UPI003C793A29
MFQSTNTADAITDATLNLVSFLYGNWNKILLSIAILVIALLVIKFLKIALAQISKDYKLPPKLLRTLNTVVTYGTLILAIVNILAVFNIQLYSLIVSLGLISAVIVLGSQLVISNLLGGTIVYIEKPFEVGDVIKVGENTGVVEGISFRSTTMRGLNGLVITIPNSTYLTISITNFTRTRQYLVKLPFTAPRDVSMSGLVDALRSKASAVPGLVEDMEGSLYKLGINKDNVDYELHFWISDPRASEEARSRVVDIIGQFLPQKDKAGT